MRASARQRAVAVSALCAAGFLALTATVLAGGAVGGEDRVVRALVVHDGAADRWWSALSSATDTLPLLVVLVMGVLVLGAAGQYLSAALLAASVLIVAAVNPLLKLLVDRPRPSAVELPADVSPSYPSGHTAVSGALLAAAVLVVVHRIRGAARWVAVGLAVGLGLLVAGSQLALGRHHPSDLVAGWLLAGTVVGLVWSLPAGRLPRP